MDTTASGHGGPFLTRPTKYNIEDSNIALLGSDLEKQVREHAGDKETAWEVAGQQPGVQIWRIEQFSVKEWPKSHYGYFYNGDSYIVLHTYKKEENREELFYDLHFWLGAETTQDEAGTAAYKTVELDDHLGGKPVQYREIQEYESARFLSYFPRFISLHGGVASGFHHVSAPPVDDTRRLYRISATQITGRAVAHLQVREVPDSGSSVYQGDVYVLDMGNQVWQFNTSKSPGKVRFKAAEFVQSLASERGGSSNTTVWGAYEHGEGAGVLLTALGLTRVPDAQEGPAASEKALLQLSDASGQVTFERVAPPAFSTLSSSDAFVLDDTANHASPAVYVWVGSGASLTERRLALQYGQWYLYQKKRGAGRAAYAAQIVKMHEGQETDAFLSAIGA
ncbi:fragmin60 [Trametes versicolor FP-101664 SS1]|uniref:fragmin60 n=1 Tax=Trametes versicolor (strain FP-101664) TaxID=717944 RepID=UPI0004624023|nr:fragmin60 [Trametes versicolor FP-101664 SS1]EIW59129.1 fragmin60 [Trametes versicolor FP-101664 SS1]